MADVTASGSLSNITVTTTLNTISISDTETNVAISNIQTATSNVGVTTTLSNIVVETGAIVSNASVRTKISVANISGFGSLAYDNSETSNGIIQYTGVSNTEIRSVLSDQNLGGYGNITYNSGNGVIQFQGVTDSEIRNRFAVTDAGGDGSLTYNSTNGFFTYTGPSAAEVRAHFSNTLPITYDTSTGVIGFDQNLSNLTLQQYQETVVSNGNQSGAITIDVSQGTLQTLTLTGDVTGITFNAMQGGGSVVMYITQDGVGGHQFDTTTTPGNWSAWNWVNGDKTIDTNPSNTSIVAVVNYGTTASPVYSASILDYIDDIQAGNITVNGVTIPIGGSGTLVTDNIAEDGSPVNLWYTNARVNTHTGVDWGAIGGADFLGQSIYGISQVYTANLITTGQGVVFGAGFVSHSDVRIGTSVSSATLAVDKITSGPRGAVSGGNGWIQFVNDLDNTPQTFEGLKTDVAGANIQGFTNIVATYLHGNGSNISNLSNTAISLTTDDVTEGSNLYYTTARANSAIVTYFGDAANAPFSINGNLDVAGNLNYVNVTDLLVDDQSITLNYGNVLQDAFIYIDRTGLNNAHIKWNETSDQWEIYDGTSTYVVPRSTSDLAEGTNLYWTTARGNTNSDAWLTTKTTDDLTQGSTNLYFANSLVDNWLTGKTTDDLTEGSTNLYYANSLVESYLPTYTGNLDSVGNVVVSGLIKTDTINPYTPFAAVRITSPRLSDVGIGSSGTSYFLPDAGPTDGQILVGYANATVQWEAPSGLTNAFATVNVSGQANVVASGDDTLILAEGSGMTITTDAGNNTVTFTSTGGYSNVDVQNFLENGYSTANIIADNITANLITATTEFIGDLDGAISVGVFNNTASTLTKGQAVYVTGAQGDEACVALANNQVAAQMPAMGIIKENISAGSSGQAVTSGTMNFAGHGFTVGADLYVNGDGLLTETIPTGEGELLQKIAKALAPNFILVQGAGRTNATPNLNEGNIFVGDSNNQAVTIDLDAFTYRIASNANIETSATVKGDTIISGPASNNQVFAGGAVYGIQGWHNGQGLLLTREGTNPISTDPFFDVVGGSAVGSIWNDNNAPNKGSTAPLVINQGSTQADTTYTTPRITTTKYGNSDFITNTLGNSVDGDWAMAIDSQARRDRYYMLGGSPAFSIPTNHKVGAIVTKTSATSANVITSVPNGSYYQQAPISNGIIAFKTMQFDVANTVATSTNTFYLDAIEDANATVMFLDDTLNVGSDEGTYYRFPPDPGVAGQVLELDSANVLQWTTPVTNSEIQAQANIAIGNNSNIVLTDTAQTITGVKTFESNVILGDFTSSSNANVAVDTVIGQFNAGRPSDIWLLNGHSSQIFADATPVTANSFSDPTLSAYNTNVYYTKWNAAESGYEIYTDVSLTANVSIGGSSFYSSTTGQAEYLNSQSVKSVLHVDEITTSDANTSNAITFSAPINTSLKQFNETVVALGNQSGNVSANIDAVNGSIFTMTAVDTITINSIPNAQPGSSYTLKITQDGTGSRTLSSSFKYLGGNSTLSTGAGNIDVISVVYDGTDYLASLSHDYK